MGPVARRAEPPEGRSATGSAPEGVIAGAGAVREPTRRLFFAFWPTESQQQEMAQATHERVSSAGGRAVPIQDLHVTLAFLGSVPQRRIGELGAIAAWVARSSVRVGPGIAMSGHGEATASEPVAPLVSLTFGRTAYWRKPGLLCAIEASREDRAAALAANLRRALTAAGFSPDLKPFRAHVTLARKVSPSHTLAHAFHPVTWEFGDIALIDSRTQAGGSLYSVVDRWILCRDGAPKR